MQLNLIFSKNLFLRIFQNYKKKGTYILEQSTHESLKVCLSQKNGRKNGRQQQPNNKSFTVHLLMVLSARYLYHENKSWYLSTLMTSEKKKKKKYNTEWLVNILPELSDSKVMFSIKAQFLVSSQDILRKADFSITKHL